MCLFTLIYFLTYKIGCSRNRKQSLEEIAQEAMQQIHSSNYLATLKELGKTEIMLVGVAFDGKEVGCVME
ncbi:hypothetical protein EI427_23765 [Flammeovirga pectinis]|uniref:Uncharacterized protein n=1 Tax=Flammeovirga pectinis TaxID=2494373 RepID=A0A3S9PAK1_9BACT|nr:hypothetical protein EI427_23765 [Flammeovirga pectinis]